MRSEEERLLIVSPVRNEADHIERTARALAEQTRPPDLWVVVDDDSNDGTVELLDSLSRELPFMRVISRSTGEARETTDRHAVGAAPRAFNRALRHVDWREFTHIGKLDGDIELPADYFEELLARFAENPSLGVAGGTLVEPTGNGRWERARVPSYHVRGALKLYSSPCFDAIGGIEERLGWDTIDETYARMRGFTTHSFDDLVARHHRRVGSAEGTLRGRARFGQAAYALRYPFVWILLRSFKVALTRPYGLSGAAFMAGYLRAALVRDPKVEDDDFRRFVRRELMARIWRAPARLTEPFRLQRRSGAETAPEAGS
jgi:GT2 family glycosyltransferase